MLRFLTAAALAIPLMAAAPAGAQPDQAPFGDKVGAAFSNYNRAWPTVGSAGLLGAGAAAEAKALGFRAIVDLRAPEEGIAAERREVETAGLEYINIPVSTRAPTPKQVEMFAALVEDDTLTPMLVHCASANRVGAMWALYRADQGVDPMVAVEEGRTIGLKPSREEAVRKRLGLAPLTQ